MIASELRDLFLRFFKEHGHTIIPSASLIPENDPTVLFTTAGMHPLVPYLLGERHPSGKRLANCEKCIRTGDIDEVGDAFHATFFEMLGNWSLGDYFKEESIAWSYEFLTSSKWLGINKDLLSITVFEGDKDAPFDKVSFNTWKRLGIREGNIYPLPKKDNWWGPPGETGPCGPDTEIFFDTGLEPCSPDCKPGCNCGKYFEIWNNVFMEYKKTCDARFEALPNKNVDTGMGVERTIAVLQGLKSIYETEVYKPIIERIEALSGKEYAGELIKPFRIISDHIKASTFIMGDPLGIAPSNLDQGYVLRRLIRRAIRQARQLGLRYDALIPLSEIVVDIYGDVYPELRTNWNFIEKNLHDEVELFQRTLEKGLKEFDKTLSCIAEGECHSMPGKAAFRLYDTYGFPIELTIELAREKGFEVDIEGFKEAFTCHQETSRSGSKQRFKGGLSGTDDATVMLHTATHLLHQALRKVLGNHVAQRGSNITAERLRFDFSHPDKMTEEEIREVERIVNEQIERDLPVIVVERSVDEAKDGGAIGLFECRYGERVKVYSIGDFSCEICGGPHVEHTGVLGHFKILKEEASSRGVRRIKAILKQD